MLFMSYDVILDHFINHIYAIVVWRIAYSIYIEQIFTSYFLQIQCVFFIYIYKLSQFKFFKNCVSLTEAPENTNRPQCNIGIGRIPQ